MIIARNQRMCIGRNATLEKGTGRGYTTLNMYGQSRNLFKRVISPIFQLAQANLVTRVGVYVCLLPNDGFSFSFGKSNSYRLHPTTGSADPMNGQLWHLKSKTDSEAKIFNTFSYCL